MTPEGDFLGSNLLPSRFREPLTSSSLRKFPARNPLGSKRSGIFDDHGKKREDPGNDVATMHPMLHPDILTLCFDLAEPMTISDDYDVIA